MNLNDLLNLDPKTAIMTVIAFLAAQWWQRRNRPATNGLTAEVAAALRAAGVTPAPSQLTVEQQADGSIVIRGLPAKA